MFKNVRMHTVLLPKYSTVAPMARVGEGDITGNVLGQGFTSTRPCTHVQGAYGAPTGAVGGAADGRRSKRRCTFSDHYTHLSHSFLREAHSVGFLREAHSVGEKNRVRNVYNGPKRYIFACSESDDRRRHCRRHPSEHRKALFQPFLMGLFILLAQRAT